MMWLEERLRTFFLFSSKRGSGYFPVVSLYMNGAEPSGSIRSIWLAICLSYSYVHDTSWLHNHTEVQQANIDSRQ